MYEDERNYLPFMIYRSGKFPLTPLVGTDTAVSRSQETTHRVYIGNTGLSIGGSQTKVGDWFWRQDFMPEGEISTSDDTLIKIRYSMIYGYAMHHLLEWWRNPDNFAQLPFPRIDLLYGITNFDLHNFRRKLFGPAYRDISIRDIPVTSLQEKNTELSETLAASIEQEEVDFPNQLSLPELNNQPTTLAKFEKMKKWTDKHIKEIFVA